MLLFLDITMDGHIMTAADYSNRGSVSVSLLVAISRLSLIAVMDLFVLMGVSDCDAWH